MSDVRFDPTNPPSAGGRVRINAGQFKGYEGSVLSVDSNRREVRFKIEVFNRPVELSLDFNAAAQLLDIVTDGTG